MPIPTIEEWEDLTEVSIWGGGSKEWKALDKAFKTYRNDQSAANKANLKKALQAFDAAKQAQGKSGSQRNRKGALVALRDWLNDTPLKEVDAAAYRWLCYGQENAILQVMHGSQVVYKSSLPKAMAETVGDNAKSFIEEISNIKQVRSAVSKGAAKLTNNASVIAQNLWNSFMAQLKSLANGLGEVALKELTKVIGQQLLDGVAKTIPVLGTVSDGLSIAYQLKKFVDENLAIRNINNIKHLTRPGDIQSAVAGLQQILNENRLELGLDLALSAGNIAAGATTFGVANAIAGPVSAGIKLFASIYSFVTDHVAMTRANRALKEAVNSTVVNLRETIMEFPFLAACVIAQIDTRTLLKIDQEGEDPWFRLNVDYLAPQLDTLRKKAREVLAESRFTLTAPLPLRERLSEETERITACYISEVILPDPEPDERPKPIDENLKKLLTKVKAAVETYKSQISGFASLPSSASKDAAEYIASITQHLNANSISKKDEDKLLHLKQTVEYLIRGDLPKGFVLPTNIKPLNQKKKYYIPLVQDTTARLYGLLNKAYFDVYNQLY